MTTPRRRVSPREIAENREKIRKSQQELEGKYPELNPPAARKGPDWGAIQRGIGDAFKRAKEARRRKQYPPPVIEGGKVIGVRDDTGIA